MANQKWSSGLCQKILVYNRKYSCLPNSFTIANPKATLFNIECWAEKLHEVGIKDSRSFSKEPLITVQFDDANLNMSKTKLIINKN